MTNPDTGSEGGPRLGVWAPGPEHSHRSDALGTHRSVTTTRSDPLGLHDLRRSATRRAVSSYETMSLPRAARIGDVDSDSRVLEAVHDHRYLESLVSRNPNGSGYERIARAAFAAVRGLRWSVDNIAPAFIFTEHAGHHAGLQTSAGGCWINNAAVAAKHASEELGMRVAIVDLDVHHGNGAQEIFDRDEDVLTVSLHQQRSYAPRTGGLDATHAPLVGGNLNVPLPHGSSIGAYVYALTELVTPVLVEFRPTAMVVAMGYDTALFDPAGRMTLDTLGFWEVARWMASTAINICRGVLVLTFEGGYSPVYTPSCVGATLAGLAGEGPVVDPVSEDIRQTLTVDLTHDQKAAVDLARLHAGG